LTRKFYGVRGIVDYGSVDCAASLACKSRPGHSNHTVDHIGLARKIGAETGSYYKCPCFILDGIKFRSCKLGHVKTLDLAGELEVVIGRFVAHGRRARRTVGGMLEEFFEHPSVTVVLGLKGDIQVKVSWDEQNLKDDAQILAELTALADRGAMDVQTMIERLGHKYAVIEGRKKEQKKKADFWVPNYEPRQGLLQYFMGLVDAENRTNAQNDKKEDGPGRKRKKEMKSEPDNKPRPSRTRS